MKLLHLFVATIAISFAFPVHQVHAKSLASKLFRYGNFCGVGHGNNSPKPPIDQLDEGCKAHDLCCKKPIKVAGTKICPCHCDKAARTMANKFLQTKRGRKNAKARRAGIAIRAAFNTFPCYCRKRVCTPKIRCSIVKKCNKKKRCRRVPRCKLTKKCKKKRTAGVGGRCLPVKCKKKKYCTRVLGKKICLTGLQCK